MQAAQEVDLANNDLGPLAWVLDELRKSLESASSALRRFVRDAAQARGQDMTSIDPGQLRIARQHMHQAVGALEMVGLAAPALMLRCMEAAAQKFIERPELCTEVAAAKVERAGFALTEIDQVSRRLADLIEQISQSASREAESANVVAGNIQHIFAVTEQTGEGTRSTAQQVRELTRMAEELRQSVSRFKIA